MTGASADADRAVVNGAASVSAVPASVPSANEGFHLFENIFGGIGVALDDTRGCDMILLCLDTVQHKVVQIFLPHQMEADELLAMMDDNGASSVTVMPYLNADKVRVTRKALAQAIEARRAETLGSACESAVRQDAPETQGLSTPIPSGSIER